MLWPWSKVTQISKLKLVFRRNSWAIWNQNSYESLRENKNENVYKWVGSHDQLDRHAHIWKKTLKNSSSPKPIDRWPWNFVCSIVYASTTTIVQIITLGWPWHILRQGVYCPACRALDCTWFVVEIAKHQCFYYALYIFSVVKHLKANRLLIDHVMDDLENWGH